MNGSQGSFLVTGANGGLGAAIVERFLTDSHFVDYHGLFVVREASSALTLKATLPRTCAPSRLNAIIEIDLTDHECIRREAGAINNRVASGEIPPLKVLILNAAFQDFGNQRWTLDNLDKTFSANYLGHWLLTLLLLKSIDKESGRIIVIGSQAHDPYDKRNDAGRAFDQDMYKTFIHDEDSIDAIAKGTWSSAKEDPSWRGGFRRYGASKMFLIMLMHELQRRLDRDPGLNRVCVVGVDPGSMSTGLQRHAPWLIRVLIIQIVYPIVAWLSPNGLVRSTHRSASQVIDAVACVDEQRDGEAPKHLYYFDGEVVDTSAESRDLKKRDWVWHKSIAYTCLSEGETVLSTWND